MMVKAGLYQNAGRWPIHDEALGHDIVGHILGAEEGIVAPAVKSGDDFIHMVGKIGRQVGAVVIGLVYQRIAAGGVVQIPVVKGHDNGVGRLGIGFFRQGADDFVDKPTAVYRHQIDH